MDELIIGTANNDILNGGIGNDTIVGLQGDDILNGGADNDRLNAGLGNDTLIGGTGIDVVDYSSATQGVEANIGSNVYEFAPNILANSAVANGFGGQDFLFEIENVIGSNFNDLIVDSNLSNEIKLGSGDDTVRAFNGGNDTLLGEAGNDNMAGGSGNDLLLGGSGNDLLNGVSGNDTLNGGSGADTFIVLNAGYSGSPFVIIEDFNSAEGDKVNLNATGNLSSYTYEVGNVAGSIAQDTLIRLNGDLIAVVQDVTGSGFDPSVDVI